MKRVLCGFAIISFSFLLSQQALADLSDGLVAYFPFNGNANDTSGNGHDGTVFGATLTEDRFGNPDSAYNFDGDDYIDIPFSPQIEPDIFSLSLWFNTTNTDNPWFGNTMISTDPDSFGCLHGYEIVVRDGDYVMPCPIAK